MIAGIAFFLIFSFIVTGTSNESFARDLFGFPIPQPPLWTYFIPFLGGFLGFIFELFSVHGLVVVGIAGLILYVGGIFMTLSERQKETIEGNNDK